MTQCFEYEKMITRPTHDKTLVFYESVIGAIVTFYT